MCSKEKYEKINPVQNESAQDEDNIERDTNVIENYQIIDVESIKSYSLKNYFSSLPINIKIFSKIFKVYDKINNESILNQLEKFITIFYRVFSTNPSLKDIDFFPPMKFNLLDDNSLLVEWIFKDFRIGFSFETDEKEWFFRTLSG